MTENNRDEKIRLALTELDDGNSGHWTSDGQPTIQAVQQLSGVGVTRADIQKCGRIRKEPATDEVAADVDSKNSGTEVEAVAEVDACIQQLAFARSDEDAATIRVRKANAVTAKALTDWLGTTKRDPTDVLRENVAKEQARKLAAIARGKNPVDEAPLPQFRSLVDAQAFMSKSSKAGGKHNSFRRLPSQR